MASATLLKSSFLPKKSEWGATRQAAAPKPVTVSMVVRAGAYDDELVKTAVCFLNITHSIVEFLPCICFLFMSLLNEELYVISG